MPTIQLTIDGMSCGHCVSAVKAALQSVPGVTVQDVKIGSAVVQADGDSAPLALIKDAVEDAGYFAEVANS